MNTTITADGTLIITPETEVEAYALSQWGKSSFTEPMGDQPSQFTGKMLIDPTLKKKAAVTPYSGRQELAAEVLNAMKKRVHDKLHSDYPDDLMLASISLAVTNAAIATLRNYEDNR